MSTPEPARIVPARSEHLAEALALLFANETHSVSARIEAALAEFRAGKLPFDGLFEARRNGRLAAAVFTQMLPGRTATLWPPRLVPDEPEETAQALLQKVVDYVRRGGVRVIHALLEGQPVPSDIVRLDQAGFTKLAELYYLISETGDFPTAEPEGPLSFERCSPEQHERLCALVETTYENTLDCPALDGVRTAADVLEGYGAGGETYPGHWFIVRHEGGDVGCLLLADYAEHGNCELTYMGLTPSARGKGWGTTVTRQAQWLARFMGRDRIVLAVDAANQPAREMYAAAGFRGWDRRHVHMLVLEP